MATRLIEGCAIEGKPGQTTFKGVWGHAQGNLNKKGKMMQHLACCKYLGSVNHNQRFIIKFMLCVYFMATLVKLPFADGQLQWH